jgi:uncharacterized membrane protein
VLPVLFPGVKRPGRDVKYLPLPTVIPSVYLHGFVCDMLLAKVTGLIDKGFGNQLHCLAVRASALYLKDAGLEPEHAGQLFRQAFSFILSRYNNALIIIFNI